MSTIIHKKSSVAGKVPLAGDLQYGELAVNYEDEKLYFKNSAGQVKSWSRNSDVYAKATETITKGQLVMFAGSQGDHILVSKADLSTPGFIDTWIVGIAGQNFAANDYGDVVWFGNVEGIDTSIWPTGTILYASTTVGGLTSTKPTQPNHIIQVAAVTNSHATQGSLIVRPTFGAHLGDLHDVYVPAPAGNDLLKWNDTTSRWESTPLKTVNGTSLIGSGNLVISGSGGGLSVSTITASTYTATDTFGEKVLLCNTASNSITINLPSAVDNIAVYHIKKTAQANSMILDANLTETIDGSETITVTEQYESLTLVSDGTNWSII